MCNATHGCAVSARALELDPSDTDALYFAAAHALLFVLRPQASGAVSLLQRAVELEGSHGM
jgi:hypothetical protein